jgi:hypothetical protein
MVRLSSTSLLPDSFIPFLACHVSPTIVSSSGRLCGKREVSWGSLPSGAKCFQSSHFGFDTLRDLPDFEPLEDAGCSARTSCSPAPCEEEKSGKFDRRTICFPSATEPRRRQVCQPKVQLGGSA